MTLNIYWWTVDYGKSYTKLLLANIPKFEKLSPALHFLFAFESNKTPREKWPKIPGFVSFFTIELFKHNAGFLLLWLPAGLGEPGCRKPWRSTTGKTICSTKSASAFCTCYASSIHYNHLSNIQYDHGVALCCSALIFCFSYLKTHQIHA